MTNFVENLKSDIDSILGIRDEIGAVLKDVYIVTRYWEGSEIGDGNRIDREIKMFPSPRVVEFKNEYKTKEGGSVLNGDIVLKMISKQSYPHRCDVDCSTNEQNIEKFYKVGGIYYRVISVKEKYLVWEVQLRRVSKQ